MSTSEVANVDVTHPDIMLARAKVYALLLQWRKERTQQYKSKTECRVGEQEAQGKLRSELDMSGILRATEEGPASAPTETGLR